MHWFSAASRILSLAMLGGLLGWYFGNALVGLSLALALVVLFWSYQMWRLQQWLGDSSQPPPDVMGVWGEIVSRIYKHQRQAGQDRQRLQSMVDYLLESFGSMRDAVVIVEPRGGIKWSNEAARSLLGLRHPEDTGQAITNLVREPDFIDYIAAEDFEQPLEFIAKGELTRHLQLVVTRFAEGDRLLFVRDISTLARMEQVRRDFVGNVSHELRTPLTVITGYLGTILDNHDGMPAAYLGPLRQMAHQAERMESLLKDLLWLSRIESEEREAKREMVDVAAMLEELRVEVANTHPERRLVIDIETQHKVTGDYRELYSAVANLTQNALKYSEQDSAVTLLWRQLGNEYQLSVSDSGIGIDPAHFERLTERFYRVDDSRSSATGGTGLGLAIVKHVAVAHGAQLQVESVLGRGSCFTLRFPQLAGQYLN